MNRLWSSTILRHSPRCASTYNLARCYSRVLPPSSSQPIPVDSQTHDRHKIPLERAAALGDGSKYGNPFPDLSQPDTLLDSADAITFEPTKRGFRNRVVSRNDPSIFEWSRMVDWYERLEKNGYRLEPEEDAVQDEYEDEAHNVIEMASASRFSPEERRKGKIPSMYVLVVVGNGNGLVGYGEAKDDEVPVARDKAYAKALRNLDYVERFENRTLWTDVEAKFGATRIILRPRPVGFGLHCNPNVHQVLKAAGIKDASAKVWGSRNPLSVIKTLFRMLHAGNAPLAMGDGIGGGARRLDKGSGLRSKDAVERDRGRKLVDLRTY
ncbi:hypothetical protein V8B97DRAFT_465141 [Scleroderma yunnanense]